MDFDEVIDLVSKAEDELLRETRLLTGTERGIVSATVQVAASVGVRVGDVDGIGILVIPDDRIATWDAVARFDLIDREGHNFITVGRFNVFSGREPKVRELLRALGLGARGS